MSTIDTHGIHDRVEYIRFIFINTGEHPTAYESFILPLAAYDSDGIMVRANQKFRRLTGITKDDIKNGRVNIFDYLNKEENKGIVGAARQAFHDEEVILQDLVCPVRPASEGTKPEMSLFKNAVFFPIIYDKEWITTSGVLLMREEKADDG